MRDPEPRRGVKSWTGEDHVFFHNQDKEEKEGYRCEYTAHWQLEGWGGVPTTNLMTALFSLKEKVSHLLKLRGEVVRLGGILRRRRRVIMTASWQEKRNCQLEKMGGRVRNP